LTATTFSFPFFKHQHRASSSFLFSHTPATTSMDRQPIFLLLQSTQLSPFCSSPLSTRWTPAPTPLCAPKLPTRSSSGPTYPVAALVRPAPIAHRHRLHKPVVVRDTPAPVQLTLHAQEQPILIELNLNDQQKRGITAVVTGCPVRNPSSRYHVEFGEFLVGYLQAPTPLTLLLQYAYRSFTSFLFTPTQNHPSSCCPNHHPLRHQSCCL
jgi:hypothetical protein